MKRGLVVIAFLLVIASLSFASFVSAETCAGNPIPAGCSVSGNSGNDLVCQFDESQADATSFDFLSKNAGLNILKSGCGAVLTLYDHHEAYYKIKDSVLNSIQQLNPSKVLFSVYHESGSFLNHNACKITQSWSTNPLPLNALTMSECTQHQVIPLASWGSFDITSIYNSWKTNNNGVGIRLWENGGAFCLHWDSALFSPPNASDTSKRPKLILEGACYVSTPPPPTCPENQIIMRLFSNTNSHGALWNESVGVYNYTICYSDIFETQGNGNHNCNGANRVISLYDITNAHAATSHDNTNYNIDVCYGDLTCRAINISKGESCNAAGGEKAIVSLLSYNNSHISNASDTNYPIKICCKPGITTGNAYWSNMIDVPINNADLMDTVKLNVAGSGLSEEINYIITKQGEASWNPLNWFPRKVADLSSFGYTTWTTTDTGDFTFTALVGGDSYTSGTLTVSATERNSPPSAIILTPALNSKYQTNVIINFTQRVYDEDDDLNVEWNFGDSNITTLTNCLTNGNCNTTHSYLNYGTKVISLTAREAARTQTATNYTRIFIYRDGLNIFPVISQPEFGEIFGGGIRRVTFNGINSYVANCTTLSNCIIPTIPSGGSTPGCYDVTGPVNLKCFDYPKDWIAQTSGYNLWFNWTFSEGPEEYGNWTSSSEVPVTFTRLFIEPGMHWAKLKLGYEQI